MNCPCCGKEMKKGEIEVRDSNSLLVKVGA